MTLKALEFAWVKSRSSLILEYYKKFLTRRVPPLKIIESK
jgi:hypothetical protein